MRSMASSGRLIIDNGVRVPVSPFMRKPMSEPMLSRKSVFDFNEVVSYGPFGEAQYS